MNLYVKDGKKYKLIASIGRRTHRDYRPDAEEHNRERAVSIPDVFISDALTLPTGLWLVQETYHSKGVSMITSVSEVPNNPYGYTQIISDRDDLATFITQFLKNNSTPGAKPGWVIGPSNSELALGICKWLAERSGIKMMKPGDQRQERRLDLDL